MRVLVATDGSPSAQSAVRLVGSLAWPKGTPVRVLEVLPPLPALVDFATPGRVGEFERLSREELAALAAPLHEDGLVVDEEYVRGDGVADLIVAEAESWRADLIVTGSRGHGPMATMLLGSVAAAITDHATCPVLIVRRETCERIVFAEDGSDSAFEARRMLARWPIFRGLQLRVVSVAHVRRPFQSGIAANVFEEARQAQADTLTEARAAHERLAKESAEELRLAGLLAQAELRTGDPATEILAAAAGSRTDLIVMGSRGRGPVTRVVLGSVARNVLLHATCSVLVVRQGRAVA